MGKPQPISVAASQVKASGNPITNQQLQVIISELTAYNNLTSAPVPNRAAMLNHLDNAMVAAAIWLTAKPKTYTTTNKARWKALRDIAEKISEVIVEDLGLKSLSGDFRAPSRENYWLERIDPGHRPGFVLAKRYETWIQSTLSINFFSYMDSIAQQKVGTAVQRQAAIGPGTQLSQAEVREYRQKIEGSRKYNFHVTMLDAQQRMQYQLSIANGGLNDIHGTFCTKNHKTHFSGDGWAIFVVAPGNTIYSHSHEVGRFHHSSFLAGGTVTTAGEICVDEFGKVAVVTAKSGHYRPSERSLWSFVNYLRVSGVLGANAVVRPGFASPWAVAMDFCQNKANATPIADAIAFQRIPTWARSGQKVAALQQNTDVATDANFGTW